jgi:bifunctional N-acetylglucosamine-1-phosphate-uridyltransferase/glucosamine-1-phosphate-acetyltransferase GlmU-like protein
LLKEYDEIQQKKLEAANKASVPDHSERIKEILEELEEEEEEEELKLPDVIDQLKDEEESLEFFKKKNKLKEIKKT